MRPAYSSKPISNRSVSRSEANNSVILELEVKIDIYGIRIRLSAKLFHQPGLANLTCALDNQRLTVSALFPFLTVFLSQFGTYHAPPSL